MNVGDSIKDSDNYITEDSDDIIKGSEIIENSEDDISEDLKDLSEDSEVTMINAVIDTGLPKDPGLDVNDFKSDWFIFCIKLYHALGYGEGHRIYVRFNNIWQTNREIKIIGWLVVPLEAIYD